MNKEQESKKGIKERLVNLPLIGWLFGIVFRTLGMKIR